MPTVRARVASLAAATLVAACGAASAGHEHGPGCAGALPAATGNPELDAALDMVTAGRPLLRAAMLRGLVHSPLCFPDQMTRDEWASVLEKHPLLLPPTQSEPLEPNHRFWIDSTVWQGASGQGPSTRAARTSLTYSFPNDGVTWGLSAISATGPNNLNASLVATFGDLDRGREHIRAAFASWRRLTSLEYNEVADNNQPMAQDVAPNPARGDVRIGGRGFGTSEFLAYNAFPSTSGLSNVGGSDMCINTSFFIGSAFNQSSNAYQYFRNTVAHEHGHGLGCIHSIPCNSTKLMEPSIQLGTDSHGIDDIRGGQRNYGDRFAGNHSANDAQDFGNLTSPALRSVVERTLSTNGTAGFGNTDEDWFRFELGSSQPVTISAAPQGGSYSAGQQLFSCFGTSASINAMNAGNLNIELLDAGLNVIGSASSAGAGSTETLNAGTLPPGVYYVRVVDVGPNTSANQFVQLYDLTIRVASAMAPPAPIAGVGKRVAANTNCYFLGDVNSRANESGATLPAGGYDWDLDGDGTFETFGQPRPVLQYVSNGTYQVSLRVTDSNGMSATDTIPVVVYGATTSLTDVSPTDGEQGQSVPVVITGTNLRNVASASEVTVSGSGVTVSGTPVSNGFGTSLSGLTFEIAPDAAPGARSVTVTNADGTATGVGVFMVLEGSVVTCPADLDGDGQVGASDLAALLGSWGQSGAADFDGGGVGASDLASLLGAWGPCGG